MTRITLRSACFVAALLCTSSAWAQYGGVDVSSDTQSQTASDAPTASGDAPAFTSGSHKRFGQAGVIEATGTAWLALGSVGGEFTFTLGLDPYIGYFIQDQIEIGVKPGFILTAGGGNGGTQTHLNLLVVPEYHLDITKWMVPFVGVGGGILRGASLRVSEVRVATGLTGDIGGAALAEGGVKIPVGNAGLIRLQAQFLAGFISGPNIYNTTLGAGGGIYF